MLTTLIWDVDGTLADTERDGHRVAFNQAFTEAGLDWHWSVELYGELLQVTGGKERILFYLQRYQPDFTQADLKGFIAHLHQRKTYFYTQLLNTGAIPLRVGVERLLREAKAAGIRLAIATTTTPENVTGLLKATLGAESLTWFECIAAGDIVPAKKPAPDMYQYVVGQMRVNPEQCLALEDSANGLKAALGAGIKTVITLNDYTRTDDFTGASLVLESLGEVSKSLTESSDYIDLARLQQLMQGFQGDVSA